MKNISSFLCILFVVVISLFSCKSSDPLAKQQAIEALDNKIGTSRYVFTAQQAKPMSGRNIQLTSEYTIKVTPDTIKAYLPYYGRAYSAPSPGSEGGIKFTSTNFEYQLSEKKKGVYSISIKTNDSAENYRLSMLIGENGYGTVHINQNDKQSISFQGIVE